MEQRICRVIKAIGHEVTRIELVWRYDQMTWIAFVRTDMQSSFSGEEGSSPEFALQHLLDKLVSSAEESYGEAERTLKAVRRAKEGL